MDIARAIIIQAGVQAIFSEIFLTALQIIAAAVAAITLSAQVAEVQAVAQVAPVHQEAVAEVLHP